jgi:hypothetical protein
MKNAKKRCNSPLYSDSPSYDQPKLRTAIRTVFNNYVINVFIFAEETLFLLFCNRKTTETNFRQPAGGCIFHLILYFRIATNSTFDLVFRTCGCKSGSISSFIVSAFNSVFMPRGSEFFCNAFEIVCACSKLKVYILWTSREFPRVASWALCYIRYTRQIFHYQYTPLPALLRMTPL